MTKESIKGDSAAESTAKHIEELILEGSLRPGELLLSEREVATRLNVSRPTLRQGMKILRTRACSWPSRADRVWLRPLPRA